MRIMWAGRLTLDARILRLIFWEWCDVITCRTPVAFVFLPGP